MTTTRLVSPHGRHVSFQWLASGACLVELDGLADSAPILIKGDGQARLIVAHMIDALCAAGWKKEEEP